VTELPPDRPTRGGRKVAAQRNDTRFTLIQALRGIAALWVVFFHISAAGHIARLEARLPAWADRFFTAGHLGVAIFFALSGFVIAHSVRGAEITPGYVGRFMLRRSIRLEPPYWASIIFVVLMALLSARVKGDAFVPPTMPQLIAHIFYLQTLLGFPQINWVYWTLTYEVQFYLVLVVLIMAAQKTRAPAALVALVPFVVTVGIWIGLVPVVPGLFVNLWHAFLAGALAYWANINRLAFYAFATVCVVSVGVTPDSFTLLSIGTAVLLHLGLRRGYIYRGLDWRWLQFLGTISYSLYLIHNPVVGAVSYLSSRWIGSDLITLLLSVTASIVVACVFWFLFERPSLALAHHIRLKPSAGAEALAAP
jgi:peptidoglycan/LPS O-acetylase OafA/YrhL